MGSRDGSPWKLSNFFKYGVWGDTFNSHSDTYQPSCPIQYLSKVMGSRGGSPWKLSNFLKYMESEEIPFMPLSNSILAKWWGPGAAAPGSSANFSICVWGAFYTPVSVHVPIQYPIKISKWWGPGAAIFSNLDSEEMPCLAILDTYQP